MSSTPSDPSQPPESPVAAENEIPDSSIIIAGPGTYYRNTRYIMLLVLVGMGIWFGYDGFVGWPRLNEQIKAVQAQHEEASRRNDNRRAAVLLEQLKKMGNLHTDWDIGLQKFLAFTLPPLGIILLLRALHNSRGEYRLDGTTLYVPGHPPVPFENITEIDRHLWDKKGIAYIHYDLGNGQQGRLRLDDFLYDRPPTDQIFDRIVQFVNPPDAAKPSEEPPAV